MKRSSLISIMALLFTAFLFCKGDSLAGWPYGEYMPVFMSRPELEKSVKFAESCRKMVDPGKIYIYGERIFINEKYRGVHIIDNSDPADPRQEAFIIAPGCLDMAVKGDIIYLDNAVDFVAFDMSAGVVTERITAFFPEHRISPDGFSVNNYQRPDDTILVRWDRIQN